MAMVQVVEQIWSYRIYPIIVNKAIKEKVKDEKMKDLLKYTHDAKLVQYVKGDEPTDATYLMELRKII